MSTGIVWFSTVAFSGHDDLFVKWGIVSLPLAREGIGTGNRRSTGRHALKQSQCQFPHPQKRQQSSSKCAKNMLRYAFLSDGHPIGFGHS